MNSEHASREHRERLMMRGIDGVATAAERAELEDILDADPNLRAEFEDYRAISSATEGVVQRIRSSAHPLGARERDQTTVAIHVGWLLALAGVSTGMLYGAYLFMMSPEATAVSKVTTGLMAAGSVILFLHALWGRLRTASTDPYREIDQ